MGKLSKEEIEEIIERDLPSYQVVKESAEEDVDNRDDFSRHRDSAKHSSLSDAISPDLDTLRQKLRGRSRTRVDSSLGGLNSLSNHKADDVGDADDNAADDTIVAVRPKKSRNPYDAGYRTKAVVISGRSKRVIGRQG
jgi:hypothetical protein